MKNLRQNGKNLHSKVEKSHLNDVRVFRPKKKVSEKRELYQGSISTARKPGINIFQKLNML